MAGQRHPLRDRLLQRARRGEFASALEIGLVAQVPQQTANRWLREAGIDIKRMRNRYLAKLHLRTQEAAAIVTGHRPLSAQERRKQVVEAVKRLNDAQAQRVAKEP